MAEKLRTSDVVYARVVKSGGLPYSHTGSMILIGPGTGAAPFRSFILERCSRRNFDDKILMFFGCRRKAEDNLYETDWENVEKWSQGNIKVVTAFSREQENKVYVQDKIRGDSSKEVWDLISPARRRFCRGSSRICPRESATRFEMFARKKAAWTKKARLDTSPN